MPTSVLELAPPILNMAWRRPHRRVLDVGCGWGKYGVLLREYVGVEVVDGCEVEDRYVVDHRLACLYDELFVCDARDLADDVLASYDGVLLVDVIEHVTLDDGRALLDRIPGWVVVCTPVAYFQNPEHETHPSESHRSVWSVEDFGDRVDEVYENDLGAVVVALRATR